MDHTHGAAGACDPWGLRQLNGAWRVEDLGKAMDASWDTGLPLTSPYEVAVPIIERIRRVLMEDDPELEEDTKAWNPSNPTH